MARKYADLVRQFSVIVGTGPFVLTSTPAGFRTFASKLATGDSFYYTAQNLDKPAEVEVGIGTMIGGGLSFTRDPSPLAATNFTVGKKQISLTVGAALYTAIQALLDAGVVTSDSIAGALALKADVSSVDAALAALTTSVSGKVDTTGLSELIDDRVAALLTGGANVTLVYDDAANQLAISSTGSGGGGGGFFGYDFSQPTNSGYLALEEVS